MTGSEADVVMAKRKQRRTVISLSAIAAILLIGIILLVFNPKQEIAIEPTITPPPTDKGSLFVIDQEIVVAVTIIPQTGAPYTLRAYRDVEMFDLEAEDRIFHGNQEEMNYIAFSAVMLEDLTLVTDSADDTQLASFGFDEPRMTWQLQFSDGSTQEFELGSVIPTGEGSYIKSADGREVFIIGQLQSSYLLKTLEEVYDLTFLPIAPSTEENPTWSNITSLKLEKPGGENIEVHKRATEDVLDMPLGTSTFYMAQPFETDCSEYMIQTIFMEAITYVAPESVIAVHPTNLTVYGLADPAVLTVTIPTTSGDAFVGRLLIGSYNDELGGRYVMIEGYDAVLLDPNGNYGFMDVDPYQLRSKIIWLHMIGDVSSVEFVLDGMNRVLELTHGEDGELTGMLDGLELTEDNARRLYTSALNIIASGGTDAPIPDTAPTYSITLRFLNGGSETVELYPLSDTEFLIVHEGVSTEAYITRLALRQNLLNRFDIVDAGGDLSRG